MRMLTETEMDQIFGGDDRQTITLPTVNVSGTRITSTGGHYTSGWGAFTTDGFFQGGGGEPVSGVDYNLKHYHHALPVSELPTTQGLRCAHDATAHPNYKIAAGAQLHIVNDYVYKEITAGDPNNGVYLHTPSSSMPGSYDKIIAGMTASNHVYLYAKGMASGANYTDAYIDPANGQERTISLGTLTARENAILVVAHEAAHTRGVDSSDRGEKIASGAGVHAIQQFRAGAGTSCPK